MSTFIFTFGSGQLHAGCCVKITAPTWGAAKVKMLEMYGPNWCWQYDEEQWAEWAKDAAMWGVPVERLIATVTVTEEEAARYVCM